MSSLVVWRVNWCVTVTSRPVGSCRTVVPDGVSAVLSGDGGAIGENSEGLGSRGVRVDRLKIRLVTRLPVQITPVSSDSPSLLAAVTSSWNVKSLPRRCVERAGPQSGDARVGF